MVNYKKQHYLLMTVDPVHIGTGGYRLGRVDNSIVREPGTRVPKIPGTSIHGAIRSYAAYLYRTPEAAGQKHDAINKPDDNPICYTFGYISKSSNNKTKAFSGVVNIFDADIVLFPVHSTVSTLWVTTFERLENAGFTVSSRPDLETDEVGLTMNQNEYINLGWLMLKIKTGGLIVGPPDKWKKSKKWKTIEKHIAIVDESIFGHIVNSNLEIRTSVSIEPKSGAAKEGALFTYEAIPRTTFLSLDVILNDYRDKKNRPFPINNTADNGALPYGPWNSPLDVVKAGLHTIEWLGIGGMGTRGMGRITIIGEPLNIEFFKSTD